MTYKKLVQELKDLLVRYDQRIATIKEECSNWDVQADRNGIVAQEHMQELRKLIANSYKLYTSCA